MHPVILQSKSDARGKVQINVDLGAAAAHRDVRVTIEAADSGKRPAMTQQEWLDFVNRTAGSISDPDFRRHEQGTQETRDPLE